MKIDLSYLHKDYQADIVNDSVITLRIEKDNNKDYVAFLHNKGIICILEHDRLIDMIDSPDKENYEVAKAILQNKSENIKSCQ